jgi:hypothetical protein
MHNFLTGGLLDERLEEDKQKDWLDSELASGVDSYKWEERPFKDIYYPYNQSTSLSCVSGGIAITCEHFEKDFVPSRKDVYIRRANYPQGGMAMPDAFKIAIKGMCGESEVLSQGQGETVMNTPYPITNQILAERSQTAFDAWITVTDWSIDNLARIVRDTPIVAFWYFNQSKDSWWTSKPSFVNGVGLYDNDISRHQACFIDAILINGKKYLVVQDTAGVGTGIGDNKNIRLIDEEALKRLYGVGYGINTAPIDVEKPKYNFTRTLKFGMKGNDVRALQEILKFEDCITLPVATDYFGGITLAGVKKLQQKYRSEILKPAGLKLPTGIFGPLSRAFINNKYN